MIRKWFNKNPILWIFILLCIIGYSYYQWLRTLPQDYTIGTIKKVYKPRKGNTRVQYFYYVNGNKEVESVSNYGYEEVALPGRRFLVEYPEDHESEGRMLLDYPVPDGIEASEGGWDEKPVFKKE